MSLWRPASPLVLLMVAAVMGVDRGNFKSCDQSGFCKRHRNLEVGSSHYELLLNTLKHSPSKIEAEILNTNANVALKLSLMSLADSTLRVTLNDASPIRERFVPTAALVGEPELAELEVLSTDTSTVIFKFSNNKGVLHVKPFRLDVYSGDDLVMSANARGLLKFEHFRQRPQDAPPEANDEPNAEDNSGADMWEESFKSHVDSKPYGPSSVGMDISFIGFENVYGLPEHADDFSLKDTKSTDPYRLYNLDVFEYEVENPMALYGAAPYILAHSAGKTVGMFWLNAAETWVDVHHSQQVDTHWMSESGLIDVFFFAGPTHVDVSRQYGRLTGTQQLPPLFAIGYHQCRWNYNDQDDVKAVDAGFDEHDLPYDVIWLDIEHTDGKKYFTWDPIKFANPTDMISGIAAKGRKMVVIVDPHIKRTPGYFVHDEATANSYYVKTKSDHDYEGWCWPGSSSYLDYMNPTVRDYWSSLFDENRFVGSSPNLHIWNDMNEPSVFNGPETTMPKDCIHHGGWEHRDIHNIYGLLHVKSTHKGLLDRSHGQERPFILTRSFFSGSQRYAAVWTGDNRADWAHLKATIPMCLSLSVAGITFVGADVGGFFGNPDKELFIRWYQAGAWQPFFRGHSHIETRRREPWLFDDEATKLVRSALRQRYKYLPYWYTLFYENERDGLPPMRPLWYEFPADVSSFKIQDQHMLGRAILVHPVTSAGTTSVDVYFPGRVWYDIETWKRYDHVGYVSVPAPLSKVPVFQLGGTIVPRKDRIRRSAVLGPNDPYTFVVALDAEGNSANGTLYVDDGYSYKYKSGSFLYVIINFLNNELMSRPAHISESFSTDAWVERILIVGLPNPPKKVTTAVEGDNTKTVEFTYDSQLQLLTIRKPDVKIRDKWTVHLL